MLTTMYLCAQFILPLIVSTLFFIIFLLTFELLKLATFFAQKETSFNFIISLIFDISLSFLPMAIPIAIFFSVIFCMNKLSNDSEYIAFRSIGYTKQKLFFPFLLVATLTSLNLLFLNQQIIPNSNRTFREKVDFLASSSLIAGLKEGQFFTRIRNVSLFPLKISEDKRFLEKIFLHIGSSSKNNLKERIIYAQKGELIYSKDKKKRLESVTLTLENGNIVNIDDLTNQVEKIRYGSYSFPLKSKKNNLFTRTRETMMNFEELKKIINGPYEEAKKIGFDRRDFFNAKYEFYNRFVTPFLCLALCLVGFTLGINNLRSDKNKGTAFKAILILIAYYGFYFSTISFSRNNNIPIQYIIYIPFLILTFYGFNRFRKLDWF